MKNNCTVSTGLFGLRLDRTAKSRHPLEEGDPCLSNVLKALDSRLRGNDFSGIHRLFAEKSVYAIARMFLILVFYIRLTFRMVTDSRLSPSH